MSSLLETLSATAKTNQTALRCNAPPPLNQLRMLALVLSEGGSGTPPCAEGELEEAWIKVVEWIASEKTAASLPMAVWKRVPLLLWKKIGTNAIIEIPRLQRGIFWAASMSVPKSAYILSLIAAYLEASDVPTQAQRWLGAALKECCDDAAHPRLEVWRTRGKELQIWDPQRFPAKLAEQVSSRAGVELKDLLAESGISSPAAQASTLSRNAFIAFLETSMKLANGYLEQHLEAVVEWQKLLISANASWSKDLSAAVINGLLEPWAAFNPPDLVYQKRIKRTLENWFGAVPERWGGHWAGASALSREVLGRWKVLDVMEQYFTLVESYAKQLSNAGDGIMQQHWEFRSRFWLAYYKKGVVTAARALIGPGLEASSGPQFLKQTFGKAKASLSAQTPQHCGLLLQINGLVVVDLSHNGKAYFFLPSNKFSPSLKAASYSRAVFVQTADENLAHNGSATHAWQAKFENYIRHHTGVVLKPSEYQLPQ